VRVCVCVHITFYPEHLKCLILVIFQVFLIYPILCFSRLVRRLAFLTA
jgi:hypothetical protein